MEIPRTHNIDTWETFDPNVLANELDNLGGDWADTDAAFRALDDTTKSVLSQAMSAFPGESNAAAETKARRSELYSNHLIDLALARQNANRAKVRYDTCKVRIDLIRSIESTNRAKATLR